MRRGVMDNAAQWPPVGPRARATHAYDDDALLARAGDIQGRAAQLSEADQLTLELFVAAQASARERRVCEFWAWSVSIRSNPLAAIALRYGVLPILFKESGLQETLPSIDEDKAKGLSLHFAPYTGDGLLNTVLRAAELQGSDDWKATVKRLLAVDFSWENTAAEYIRAYRRVTRRIRGR